MRATFQLLPAIDLRGGRVVRLVEGDFDRETVFGDDPGGVAAGFVEAGASWIHVVDLDAARTGERSQGASLRAVIGAAGGRARIQVGGGIRDADAAAALLAAGADRVVVGTAALRDPAFAGRLVRDHGAERIVAAIDVREGMALGDGWTSGAAGLDATQAVNLLADQGVRTFAVTAIDRDGRLEGPDTDLLAAMVSLDRGAVIASGGISSLADLEQVRGLGCTGAIVGRALYDGRIKLAEALATISA
jgi:phosphoribosylformimino-5-aminoimidazole carboxamide ribotide isomerase